MKRYKKVLKLKKEVKENIKEVAILLLSIIAIVALLNIYEQDRYNKAVARCGGKDNVVSKYDNHGDKFYYCINELERDDQ